MKIQNSSEIKADIEFPIVGIGASAGGLNPITRLLEKLPIDTGMSFVVIQHLAAGQESMLPEILARSTKMKVLQVTDGMKVEKNHVYVITPGTTMTLKNGCLRLIPKGSALKPINDFMISIALILLGKVYVFSELAQCIALKRHRGCSLFLFGNFLRRRNLVGYLKKRCS